MIIVDEAMLDRFRGPGRCEWCKLRFNRRDPHHLRAKGMGGGSRLDIAINLISLCRGCHDMAESGHIEKFSLLAIVATREGVLQHEIEEEVARLLRTPRRVI